MSNINGGRMLASFLRCLIPAAVVLSALSSASQALEGGQASKQEDTALLVERHYQSLSTLAAKVRQKNFYKSLNKTQIFEGTIVVKKPGRLRLDYTNGQTIVINSDEAWFYSKKSRQAIKRSFKDFDRANIPVAFLLGAASIRDDFDAAQPGPERPREIELFPKKPSAAMKKLRIKADENGRIIELVIFDRSGNVTEISFSEIQEGGGVDDNLFVFRVPEGTEVIEQ